MKYLLPIILMIQLTSCKKEFISPEVKLSYESVMAVHDDVMPEMSTINKLKRGIKKINASSEQSLDMLTRLENADEGMMLWMSEFKLDRASNEQNQLNFLKAEQLKIDKVSADMKQVISDASAYLKELKK